MAANPASLNSMKPTVRARYNVAKQLVLHEASESGKAGQMRTASLEDECCILCNARTAEHILI